MLELVQNVFKFFIPDSIEDNSQKTTDIKLATGIVFGFTLVGIAIAIVTGNGQVIMQRIHDNEISNDVIYLLLGVLIIWFTLTKIGIKKSN